MERGKRRRTRADWVEEMTANEPKVCEGEQREGAEKKE